jgi:predicted DCC family thiol-disulfide oxidoreductase YuxK
MPVARAALTIFCDTSCPVCSLEVELLSHRDRGAWLTWIDISAPGFDAAAHGFSQRELDAVIHAVRADGSVVRGLDVLRLAYGAAGLGWLAQATRRPVLKAMSDAGYRLFARHRHAISRVLAPVLPRPRRAPARSAEAS